MSGLHEYKYPKKSDKNKYVGIEIEFACNTEEDVCERLLSKYGLDKYVTMGEDGSIDRDDFLFGYEWRILCKQSEINKVVSKVGEVISLIGGEVNESCGLHVHLDVRKRNKQKVFNNLVKSQKILYGIAHGDRILDSGYSSPMRDNDIDTTRVGKGNGINPYCNNNRDNKQTIEVRIREGIIDAKDIIKWTKLLVAIADSKEIKENISSIGHFQKQMKSVHSSIKSYVKKKYHWTDDKSSNFNRALEGLNDDTNAY